uniref:DUF2490 domain-containing protein n=1 Tax=Solibacter usitatus (strain Ellin6076) TaxID=234267 RepID=Q021M2_SOLUE
MAAIASPTLALLLTAAALPLAAQNSRGEFWPELDIFAQRGDQLRIAFIDGFKNQKAEFGCYLDIALKPLFRRELRNRGDVFRQRFLTFRAGYQYTTPVANNDSSSENRAVAEATARYPLPGKVVVVDRNRGDFRFVKGQPFSMRYRNRLRIERDLELSGMVFTPFAYDETFYSTKYGAWNRNRYAAGIEFPVGPHVVVAPYLLRQRDTRASVKFINALGLTLSLFF